MSSGLGARLLVLLARYEDALQRIAEMPTSERNPDGVEQAAESMRTAAKDALTPTEAA